MPTFGMDTFAGRLKDGIGRLPPDGKKTGNKNFLRALKAHAAATKTTISGISVGSLDGYLKGRRLPSIGFIEAAAHVFGVRFEWLRTGEGDRTEHGEAANRVSTSAARDYDAVRIRNTLNRALAIPDPIAFKHTKTSYSLGTPEGHIPSWVAPVGALVARFAAAEGTFTSADRAVKLEAEIGKALAAPLRTLGLHGSIGGEALEDYIQTMVAPLLVLARVRGRRGRLSLMELRLVADEPTKPTAPATKKSKPKKQGRK